MEVLCKKLRYPALSLALDDSNDEGVIGTTQGIYFNNFRENIYSLLVGSPSRTN